jgi:hypothetical protein
MGGCREMSEDPKLVRFLGTHLCNEFFFQAQGSIHGENMIRPLVLGRQIEPSRLYPHYMYIHQNKYPGRDH